MDKPNKDSEHPGQFEERKKSHIKLALRSENQAIGQSGLDRVQLLHEALPDLNFEDVNIASQAFQQTIATPFLISSMTAGHLEGEKLNMMFAHQAAERGWMFAVGSQRRELTDSAISKEWRDIRKQVPNFVALGNLGLAQIISTPIAKILDLAEGLQASAMIVHLNSLQEALQPEGTPQFAGGLRALEKLVKQLEIPVVVKETGCGFSKQTLARLNGMGLYAVDVSGFGGTHWGRIEGDRAKERQHRPSQVRARAAETFADWGISTVDSVAQGSDINPDYQIWASGGVRTGLDAAKLLALGAKVVGFAKPILEAAMMGEEELSLAMETIEFELRTALFCTGAGNIEAFQGKKVWQWK